MDTWKSINKRLDSLNLKKGIYPFSNKYGIPTIIKQDVKVNKLIPFGKKEKDGTAHFFLDDYAFERVWNTPKKYINTLKQYDNVLSPDFSLYTDYPIAVQIWNTYRNRWLGRYWQSHGIQVIPTVGWSTPESYDFCYLGIEEGSKVAVGSIGILKSDKASKLFNLGINEMVERLHPEKIIFYGEMVKGCKHECCCHPSYAKTNLRGL